MVTVAKYDDVVRLFPGIQDHAVLEIEALSATVGELEAASLLLQDDDEALIEFKQSSGDRLNQLLAILANAKIQPPQDFDR